MNEIERKNEEEKPLLKWVRIVLVVLGLAVIFIAIVMAAIRKYA
jgi:hypothetical protein